MKTKRSNYSLLLTFITILFFNVSLLAVKPPVNEIKAIASEKLSKQKIEQQLGRKLKLKEKLAIRIINNEIERTEKRKLNFELTDGNTISGYLSKSNNDSIYLSNDVDKWNPQSSSKGETFAIAVNQIDKISHQKISKNATTKSSSNGSSTVILLLSIFAMGIGVLLLTNADKKIQEYDGIPPSIFLGVLIMLLGAIGFITGLIIFLVRDSGFFRRNNTPDDEDVNKDEELDNSSDEDN